MNPHHQDAGFHSRDLKEPFVFPQQTKPAQPLRRRPHLLETTQMVDDHGSRGWWTQNPHQIHVTGPAALHDVGKMPPSPAERISARLYTPPPLYKEPLGRGLSQHRRPATRSQRSCLSGSQPRKKDDGDTHRYTEPVAWASSTSSGTRRLPARRRTTASASSEGTPPSRPTPRRQRQRQT